jgi:hypothetical protein
MHTIIGWAVAIAVWMAGVSIFVAGWLLASGIVVWAHDDAKWIQERAIKNAVGELCCGEHDCKSLAEGDIQITANGYRIKSLNETVPFSEALPLPNDARTLGLYWRCEWGGQRKCFFAPHGGS